MKFLVSIFEKFLNKNWVSNNDSNDLIELKKTANEEGIRLLVVEVPVDYKESYDSLIRKTRLYFTADEDLPTRLGNLYQNENKKRGYKTIILVNWKGDYKDAISWGLKKNLLKTSPHIPLAILKEYPELVKKKKVVETKGCTIGKFPYAFCVFLNGRKKLDAGIFKQDVSSGKETWFSFERNLCLNNFN